MSGAAEYKVRDRFKESKTYVGMGGMAMREIDLAVATQADLKIIFELGNTEIVEKVETVDKKGPKA